ncbi:hypothetical protein IMSHALPRED_001819 [Imshaugia aleurites]|uniref:F-box domain-containing protein n=1 Tax=Imshaugia aleurites TaxID=172621 RepID=A0A8H3PFQ4_9LECA|nr:hypothetical protein IMSHALPRED_001819 [Imshaugia aleurites]
MAPQLQDFPDELLVDLLSYLPKPDLKSARLTCTRFAHVGAQWLLQRVYFAPNKAVMEIFLNISANPIFARTVTELVYDSTLFLPELTSYKPFQEAIADGLQAEVYSTDFLADSLVSYVRLVDQQQGILEDQKDYKALITGLRNFSNIERVIVLDTYHHDHDRSWYDLHFHGPHIAKTLKWPRDGHPEDDGSKKWHIRGIRNLIRTVSVLCQKLKELSLATASSCAPMTIFEMDGDEYEKACTMAQRLTSLELNLYVSRNDSHDGWHEQNGGLSKFLSETKQLRSLVASGRIDPSVFNDKVWPHLETLSWSNAGLDAKCLKAITQVHKSTLRELRFCNVKLFGDQGWIDAAIEIGKYLRLRCVTVFGVCDEVTMEATGDPYLEDEINLVVARKFMQSIPNASVSATDLFTIIACPEKGEVGVSHSST